MYIYIYYIYIYIYKLCIYIYYIYIHVYMCTCEFILWLLRESTPEFSQLSTVFVLKLRH